MDKQKELTNIYNEEKALRSRLAALRVRRIRIMRDLRSDGMSYQAIGNLYGETKKQYIISLVKSYKPE